MARMVLSFSRPDPSSPSAVAGASFSSARRGFDQAEVRDFLRMVSAEMSRLQERVVFLERELRDVKHAQPLVHAEMTEATIAELLGEETARIIEAAREAAHKIKERSEEAAGRIIKEASEEAARIREETELECARRRQDATSDAEAEILMAKQQGREMVNEARAYRERVLADVARRRELAREQLQDLHHGRERLVHAFERARTATDDVLRDLVEPSDEPMEFVNLAPTTGPVPVIVQADDIERLEAIRPPSSAPVFTPDDNDTEGEPQTSSRDLVHESPVDASDDVQHSDSDLDDSDAIAVRDITMDDVTANDLTSDDTDLHDDTDDDEVVAPMSNVVPLFARTEPVRSETVRTEPSPIEPSPIEPVQSEDRTVTASIEPEPETQRRRPVVDAGDIFERLRKASTESVAADVSRHMPREPQIEEPVESIDEQMFDDEPFRSDLTEVDTEVFTTRNEVLVPVIVAMSRMAKRVLADEQNQVLDILRGKPVVRSIDVLVGSRTEHAGRYVASLKNLLSEAALAGARSLSDDPESALVHKIETQLSDIHEFVASTIVDPLRERLERSLSQSSDSNAELAGLARLVYREWKNHFIDDHMDDVALTAYGRGAAAILTPGMRVCWKVDPDGPACADAEDNSLGGFVSGGEEFPTGHTHAPAHSGCRCVLVSDQN
jgi:DivIVA domain-containing protein